MITPAMARPIFVPRSFTMTMKLATHGMKSVITVRAPLATDRSASPWETRTRLVVMIELPIADLAVNQPIFDTAGRLIGIPDLLDPATELVVETDGSAHRRLGQRSRDHGRDDRFELSPLALDGEELLRARRVERGEELPLVEGESGEALGVGDPHRLQPHLL